MNVHTGHIPAPRRFDAQSKQNFPSNKAIRKYFYNISERISKEYDICNMQHSSFYFFFPNISPMS